jgi:hypothetical protein
MPHGKTWVRIAMPACLGAFLLAATGCGNGTIPVDPDRAEKLKQARINAYGQTGYESAKGAGGQTSAPPTESAQAAARRKAMQGGR